MRRRVTRSIHKAAFVGVVIGIVVAGIVGAPAQAQVAPPPTLPPETEPALELVSPILSPQCANVAVVLVVVSALSDSQGVDVPVDVKSLFGPVFVACGSVPVPEPSTQLVCGLDEAVAGVGSTVTVEVIGAPLPVDTRVVGPLGEFATNLAEALSPVADTTEVVSALNTTLNCRPLIDPPPQPPAPPEPNSGVEPPQSAPSPPSSEITLPPLGSGGVFLPPPTHIPALDIPTEPTPILGEQAAVQLQPPSIQVIGFAYPGVLALPILVLALGGYLARALTTEVHVPPRRSARG